MHSNHRYVGSLSDCHPSTALKQLWNDFPLHLLPTISHHDAITDFVLVDANQDLNVADPTADYLVFLEEGADYSLSALQTQFGTTDFALLSRRPTLPI